MTNQPEITRSTPRERARELAEKLGLTPHDHLNNENRKLWEQSYSIIESALQAELDRAIQERQTAEQVERGVAVYARNLLAAQQILAKGYIRHTDFEDVVKIIDEAHNLKGTP